MKKIMIFAAMAAMFSLASCQKDEVVANNESKVSPVFTASINAGTTKTTVNVSTGKIKWENTDEITITDNGGISAVYEIGSIDETTGRATFTRKSGQPELGKGPYTATYGSAPSTYQTYSATAGKLYMTAPETSNNSFNFTVKCGLMKLNLKSGETITHIAVTGTPTDGTKKTYTMYCPGGVDISSGKDFFIALPAGSYDKIEIYKYGATNGFEVCSLSPSTSIAVSANHIKPVKASGTTIAFSDCQNLPGVFSVSKDNGATIKQVRFSKGNLQASYNSTTSSYTWDFAANQYSYVGNAVGNTSIDSQTNGAVVDLFGWSTDASSNNWGIYTKITNTANYSTGSFNDWGVAYCESNDITDVDTWRTLSKDEWTYLFNTRSNASNLYKCGVTVCGKTNCVVLLPDDWQWDTNTVGTDWQTGGYSMTDIKVTWQTMEAAGAVCLPAAGSRNCADVNSVGVNSVGGSGYYWSSTANTSIASSIYAYDVNFNSSSVTPNGSNERYYGFSVRLITECQ